MDTREKLLEILKRIDANGDACITGIAGLADLLIENGVTVQQWIPVKKRLPEKNGKYICRYGFRGNTRIMFTGILEYYATDPIPHWQHESMGVTCSHWMPLPEPPREDDV